MNATPSIVTIFNFNFRYKNHPLLDIYSTEGDYSKTFYK